MILTNEEISQITDEEGVYTCGLITQHFAYRFLKDQVSPLGNIFCFSSPVRIGPLGIEEAFVLAGELPNTNMHGAVCFQRLYATQLGSLLSVLTGKEYYVEDSCLFADGLQMSISILNQVKNSVVFNMIFPIMMFNTFEKFGILELNEKVADFTHNAIESFKYLNQSIFVETRRDNF